VEIQTTGPAFASPCSVVARKAQAHALMRDRIVGIRRRGPCGQRIVQYSGFGLWAL